MTDFQIVVIVVGVFLVAVASLLFVYKLGTKEKSYEEAVAEQRYKTNALFPPGKPKPKEKKPKKVKKLKEKIQTTDTEKSEESENAEQVPAETPPQKPHVEFTEATVVVDGAIPVVSNKKQNKKEKVKPILLNKEKPENVIAKEVVEAPPANHFEKLHPKDEFELLYSQIKTKDDVKTETHKEKTEKSNKAKQTVEQEPPKSNNKRPPKQQPFEEPIVKEEAPQVVASVPKTNEAHNLGKEKKKKKSEFNTLQQLVADKQGINLSAVLNLVRKADLSRSEVQILIDLLLNKQQEASNLDDWSEGKSDPVQKLKKQLAEKEKALLDEQEALYGVQQRLREVRAEQISEKSQLQQQIRGLEEALQNVQLETQKLNGALHINGQQLQQLQTQLNEERMNAHKLREEHAALMMQRQQQECIIVQAQEAESIVTQLRGELQELSGRNNQLSLDLHAVSEQSMVEKEGHQNYIAQLQMKLSSFQKESEQKNEILKKHEESRINLERHLDMAQRQENDLKVEIARLKSVCQQGADERRGLEHGNLQLQDEKRILQQQNEHLDSLLEKLQKDLEGIKAEKLKVQEAHLNGEKEQMKTHEVEILNLRNEVASLKTLLHESKERHDVELNAANSTISKLENEVVEQRNKNNELRQKNWKVMEALSAAESRIKHTHPGPKLPDVASSEALIMKARQDEQEFGRQFIERLFPEVEKLNRLPQNEWLTEAENAIRTSLHSKLENGKSKVVDSEGEKVLKLEAEVQHYKNIIDDTEGMLNKLQAHIEHEEIQWRNVLKAKDLEIDALRKQQQLASGHVEIR